jgi:ATP adenylyltransferase
MRMSPIDQQLMLLELLGHGFARQQPAGPGTGHRPADSGKRMVGRVLTGNGITRYGDGLTSLIGAEEMSDSERDALLQLCRQRLNGFREQRGEEVFAHRSRHRSPISGFVKYRVFTRALGGRECRGTQKQERSHWMPRRETETTANSKA